MRSTFFILVANPRRTPVKIRQTGRADSLQLFTWIDPLFTTSGLLFVFPFPAGSKSRNQEVDVKSKIAKIALFGVVAMALVAGIAFAHAEGGPMHRHAMRGEFMGGREMGFPMRGLNLTGDQH